MADLTTDQILQLIDMRGGCTCCISPPCRACCDPITAEEAERLGLEEEFAQAPAADAGEDAMAIVRAMCGRSS